MLIYQNSYDIRRDWAKQRATTIAEPANCYVIVDTLSFSSCVDIASARG